VRGTLAEELGIEPSAELRALERQLLDQDPGLLGSHAAAPSAGRPQTQYAMSGPLAIAYQVVGDGPIDVLVMPTGYSMMEPSWEWPALRSFWRRLGRVARVVLLDQRGMGLSDRVAEVPTPEERLDDVRAVADAVGATRFALFGGSAGGATSALFAATYPERVQSLVLVSPLLLGSGGTSELPGWADTDEDIEGVTWYLDNRWGSGESAELRFAPSLAGDARAREWVARMERLAGTPTSMAKVIEMNLRIDVRAAVPTIAAPTLVIQRTGDLDVPVAHGRYYAEHIPGAEYLELPGNDHWWWVGENAEEITGAIEAFLGRHRSVPEVDRVLKTVLHADVLGPDGFAAPSPTVHETLVAPVITEHRGIEVNAGIEDHAVFFDGPARAIRCARALVQAADDSDVTVRVGLHAGECDLQGDQLGGLAIRISRSVTDLARPSEVLVTSTVRDLVAGSATEFVDRGRHTLGGSAGDWQVLALGE
jgi:pimeloyl-ACP methyl ester carboxylesterase/class 3 adenylate cyclase